MDQCLGRAWVSMALTAKVPRRIKGLMEVLQVSIVVAGACLYKNSWDWTC